MRRLLAHLYARGFRKAESLAARDPELDVLHRRSLSPAIEKLPAYWRQAAAGPIFRSRTTAKQNREWSNGFHGPRPVEQGNAAGDAADGPIFSQGEATRAARLSQADRATKPVTDA